MVAPTSLRRSANAHNWNESIDEDGARFMTDGHFHLDIALAVSIKVIAAISLKGF
jgi:hypothetical protein